MFFTEEDVTPIVDSIERALGKSGNMIHNARFLNVTLATRKHGKLWYGDLDMSANEFNLAISALAKGIGEKLFILNDGELDFGPQTLVFSN